MAAAASVLEVLIIGDATSLKAALGQATVATQQFAATTSASGKTTAATTSGISKLGKVATIGYTAAAAGAFLFAKASLDSALEFNRAFTEISALTNATDAEVGVMRDTVMSLSAETAQSPVELAHAMYFLASAGLDTQQQFEAIDAVARGMAVGLGEAGDLARITANALNVFGKEGLQASDVMDVLVAAIREGTAEPDEFADALGRVLPIADKAGISFQQVAASLSTMSNAGLDVHEGVTALRAILQSLVSPTAQTEDAFRRIGVTVDEVVASMKGEGLISTLRFLDTQTKNATDSEGEYNQLMRKIIPNIRGLAGAFNLTGQEAKKVDAIFKAVMNSNDDLAEAFSTTAESDAFRIKQAFQQISNAGMELATNVLPGIADALSFIVGPLTGILPLALKLGEAWLAYKALNFVIGLVRGLATAQTLAAGSAHALATAEVEAGAAMKIMSINASTAAGAVKATSAAQIASKAATARWAGGFVSAAVGLGLVAHAQFTSIMQGADDLAEQFAITEEQAAKLQSRTNQAALFGGGGGLFHELADPFATSGTKAAQASEQFAALGQELAALGVPQEAVNKAFDENTGLLNANRASIDPWIEAVRQSALEQAGLDQATLDANAAAEAQAEVMQQAREETAKWQHSVAELTGPLYQLTNIGLDVTGFLDDFKTSIQEADDPMAAFEAGLAKIKQAAADWRAEVGNQLTGIGDVLSTLDEKAHLSTDNIHDAFIKAAQDAKDFAADLKTISETKGQVGRDLATALLEGGFRNTADVIAGAGKEMRNSLVGDFGDVLKAGTDGARSLQNVIAPVLRNIRDLLFTIAQHYDPTLRLHDGDMQKQLNDHKESLKHLSDTQWTAHLHADAAQATAAVAGFREEINNIPTKKFVEILVHTRAASPWPDEALQAHLVNPLKKLGAKEINGVWTVPLEIGVHTATSSLAIQKAMAAAPKGFAIAKDAVGADRYYKIMKAIKEDAHKTGELHLKALRKIIADESSSKRARAWAEAAVEAFDKRMAQADEPPPWIQNALRDVPKLPRGDTDISVNHHDSRRRRAARHGINIKLDRKIYADAMTQEVSYGRGY